MRNESPDPAPDDGTGDWHARPPDAALTALEITPEGLTDEEAVQRFARYGPNRLPEPKRQGAFVRFARQFHNLLIYVLVIAAAVTATLDHVVDSAVILAVVLVNAVIGYVQEGKAERALTAIRAMLAPQATLVRAGRRRTVPGEDVVPGDVVVLEPGDRVPADLRLLEARGLKIRLFRESSG